LEFAVSTGCLNILYINTVLSDEYDEYFGFKGKDVSLLCRDYNAEHKYDIIKERYNGYIFGKTNVYNPWSLIRYVKDILADDSNFPSAYWANTSSNSIVKSCLFIACLHGSKNALETILGC
jgi:hypothetical protein